MEDIKYFYRVNVSLLDDEPGSILAFDFSDMYEAISIATTIFRSCDILKVWVEVIENEVNTTNSPMWR